MFRIALVILILAAATYFVLHGNRAAINRFTATDISQLLANPGQYDGHPITVTGIVQESAAVLGVGGYRLRQGSSELYIVSSHGIPPTGAEISVSGTFKQALSLGNLQYSVIVEQR